MSAFRRNFPIAAGLYLALAASHPSQLAAACSDPRDPLKKLAETLQKPEPVIPLTLFWELGARFSHRLQEIRDPIEGLFLSLQKNAPQDSSHLYHWNGDRGPLGKKRLKVFILESDHPMIKSLVGDLGPVQETALVRVSDSHHPDKVSDELIYLVFIDHFFKDPNQVFPEELATLELNLAGDLWGRIRGFMADPSVQAKDVQQSLGTPKAKVELDYETLQARIKFLKASTVAQDRSEELQAFFRSELAKHFRAFEPVEFAWKIHQLTPIVPFGLIFKLGSEWSSAIPSLKLQVVEMLTRIKKYAGKDNSHLFHWKKDPKLLRHKDYTLLLTTSHDPQWGRYASVLGPGQSGTTIVMPEDIKGAPRQYHIVQIIFVDKVLIPEIPPQMRPFALEGNLAFETIGKAGFQIGVDFALTPPNRALPTPLDALKADLEGAKAQANHLARMLADEEFIADLPDHEKLKQFHQSAEQTVSMFQQWIAIEGRRGD